MWCATCETERLFLPDAEDPAEMVCVQCHSSPSQQPGSPALRWDSPHSEESSDEEIHDDVCVIEPPPVLDDAVDWHPGHVALRPDFQDSTSSSDLPGDDQAAQVAQAPSGAKTVRRRSSILCWAMLMLGVALFACGGSLIGFSLLGDRGELWSLGTPLALAGQAAFLIGLVLQLDVIWYQSRQTSRNVSRLDVRLTEMQDAPEEHCELAEAETAHRFDRDIPQETSPQFLLRDLKGQLELLANRLSHESEKL